ncbi:hypothetical protein [Aeromonas jandaei]|uniref:hypothetical protein n=1 Tax=Aeromonas jandaei TaxID=650 RepID=UPI003BA019AF
MNIKLSHIGIALLASSSFSALANQIVAGSNSTATGDIVVELGSIVGLNITPNASLTIDDVLQGPAAKIATFNVLGEQAAVRFIDADADDSSCSYLYGKSNNNHKLQVCLGDVSAGYVSTDDGTIKYYKYSAGSHVIIGGKANTNTQLTNVGADDYTLKMEVVKYNI